MSYKNNSLQRDKKMTYNDVSRVAPDCFPKRDRNIMLGRDTWLIFSEETWFFRALLKLCTLVGEKVGNFGLLT